MGRKPHRAVPRREMADPAGRHQGGNISETCWRHGIAPNRFYRWRDEAEQGAKARLAAEALPPLHVLDGVLHLQFLAEFRPLLECQVDRRSSH